MDCEDRFSNSQCKNEKAEFTEGSARQSGKKLRNLILIQKFNLNAKA